MLSELGSLIVCPASETTALGKTHKSLWGLVSPSVDNSQDPMYRFPVPHNLREMVRSGELQSIPPRPKLWGDADVPEVGREGAEPSSP